MTLCQALRKRGTKMSSKVRNLVMNSTLAVAIFLTASIAAEAIAPEQVQASGNVLQTTSEEMRLEARKKEDEQRRKQLMQQAIKSSIDDSENTEHEKTQLKETGSQVTKLQTRETKATEPQAKEVTSKNENRSKEEIIQDPDSRLKDLVPYLTGEYESNLEMLAHLIHAEAEGSSDIEQQLVGTVAVYRAFTSARGVRTDYEAIGSLEAVIYAPKQYSESLENGRFFEEPEEACYRNAEAVLSGKTLDDTPRTVLYQATFIQGDGVYKSLNNIFCFENDIDY